MAEHNAIRLSLFSRQYIRKKKPIILGSYRKQREDMIKGLLEIDLKKRCENCGALGAFDLIIVVDGKTEYYFALWKVVEDGKTIAETDYKRLYQFLTPAEKEKVK